MLAPEVGVGHAEVEVHGVALLLLLCSLQASPSGLGAVLEAHRWTGSGLEEGSELDVALAQRVVGCEQLQVPRLRWG